MTVQSVANGAQASTLAESLVHQQNGLTFVSGSTSTDINVGGTSTTPSNNRGLGSFEHGTVAAGTPLPSNQLPAPAPATTYSGGIGITTGVVLCTGPVTDADPALPSGVAPDRGVGAEGPNNGISDFATGTVSIRYFEPADHDFLNRDFRADFNRDGVVNGADYTIWQDHEGLAECANRFEGDADKDGDVDADDYDLWDDEYSAGGGGMAMMMGSGGGSGDPLLDAQATAAGVATAAYSELVSAGLQAQQSQFPGDWPDANGDGVVNLADAQAIRDHLDSLSGAE